jgi:Protein of unknown function (DUF2924)
MESSMIRRIHALRQMTVGELQVEWQRLYGEPSRSRNRDFLWRRLAWRVQELALGGLSDRARQRLEQLAPDSFIRARTPALGLDVAAPAQVPRPVRDMRMPSVGTVLTRQYRGREIRVVTLADGFEWDGHRYGSLSEVARAVTGARWNGRLFFGLTTRKR